jgi:hypothetical protein
VLQRLARVAGGHRNSPAAERRRSRRAATNSGIAPRGCRRARRRRICRQAGTRCAGGGASRQAIRDVAPEELAGAHGELGAWREDPAACRHKQRHSEAATGSGAAVTVKQPKAKGNSGQGEPHAERRTPNAGAAGRRGTPNAQPRAPPQPMRARASAATPTSVPNVKAEQCASRRAAALRRAARARAGRPRSNTERTAAEDEVRPSRNRGKNWPSGPSRRAFRLR